VSVRGILMVCCILLVYPLLTSLLVRKRLYMRMKQQEPGQ
jgi:ABC-2 type transport system permease protein